MHRINARSRSNAVLLAEGQGCVCCGGILKRSVRMVMGWHAAPAPEAPQAGKGRRAMGITLLCSSTGRRRDTQPYYRNHVKSHFRSHAEESDPERVAELITRAKQDAVWVLKKVIYRN